MAQNNDFRKALRLILKDVRVELKDEFDKNFERQAFFTEAWERRRDPQSLYKGRGILRGESRPGLRESLKVEDSDSGVTFSYGTPYAAIHNEGGEIKVTAKMRKFFWAKYYAAKGGMGRKKNGELRQNKKNAALSDEATFWKHMALMKVGSVITIPKRQFLGEHPQVERQVSEIIEKVLGEFFNEFNIIKT